MSLRKVLIALAVLGMAIAILSSACAANIVLSTELYDSYGNRIAITGTNDTPYGYGAQHGYYTDCETGLILATYRYYDPTEGRWLTRDPIGYSGGLNLYGYCGGDPVNGIDPLGLCEPGDDPWSSSVGQFALGFANSILSYAASLAIAGPGQTMSSWQISQTIQTNGFVGTATGTWHGLTDWITTDDPYKAGNSFGNFAILVIGSAAASAEAPRVTGTTGVVKPGTTIYRVYGGGSPKYGGSWTTVDPLTVPSYRSAAGLPDVNSGQFLVQGTLVDSTGAAFRPGGALPLNGNAGGLTEIVISGGPSAVKGSVRVNRVGILRPPM